MAGELLKRVAAEKPRVHCISNYVTINDCANILLACGALPVMADDPRETAEVTAISSALVINMGTLHDYTVPGMLRAGEEANRRGIPVVLDPVGAGMSAFRRETAEKLLKRIRFSVIRGNISEIKALCLNCGNRGGVDAAPEDVCRENREEEALRYARQLSGGTGAVIAVSGAKDVLVSPEGQALKISNGHPSMAGITGTGCMLSVLMGAFAAVSTDLLSAAAAADGLMGLAGERAYRRMEQSGTGTGSMRVYLLDEVSRMTPECLEGGIQIARI